MIILVFDLDDTLLMSNEYTKYENIKFNSQLSNLLNSIKYKKIIYSNGTYGHVNNSLPKLVSNNIFNEIYARDTIPAMKPHFKSFNYVKNSIFYNQNLNKYKDISYIFFDDNLDNMKTAKEIGWTTVWIPHRNYNTSIKNNNYNFVDYKYDNIIIALNNINTIINYVNQPIFIPSNNFKGAKNGFHFKKGNNGLGYYKNQK
jgi:FMN phosphatase YigB (HAD superfamily)